jgi:hypothetical protein
MSSRARIDRTKHEVDVTEHVARGCRIEDAARGGATVVDVGVKPWLAGHVLSAVHAEVLDRSADDYDDDLDD